MGLDVIFKENLEKDIKKDILIFYKKLKEEKEIYYIDILKELGAGANSTVYEISDKVALKENNGTDYTGYELEYYILKDLETMNLNCFPKVYCYDEIREFLFVENIKGVTLKQLKYISKEKELELYKLFYDCVSNKIQLNDLHSENIILKDDGSFSFIDVGDFTLDADEFTPPEFFNENLDIKLDYNLFRDLDIHKKVKEKASV